MIRLWEIRGTALYGPFGVPQNMGLRGTAGYGPFGVSWSGHGPSGVPHLMGRSGYLQVMGLSGCRGRAGYGAFGVPSGHGAFGYRVREGYGAFGVPWSDYGPLGVPQVMGLSGYRDQVMGLSVEGTVVRLWAFRLGGTVVELDDVLGGGGDAPYLPQGVHLSDFRY